MVGALGNTQMNPFVCALALPLRGITMFANNTNIEDGIIIMILYGLPRQLEHISNDMSNRVDSKIETIHPLNRGRLVLFWCSTRPSVAACTD